MKQISTTIPEQVIPAKDVTLENWSISVDGTASLNFTDFPSEVKLSDDQMDRILDIILESSEAEDASPELKAAKVDAPVSRSPSESPAQAVDV